MRVVISKLKRIQKMIESYDDNLLYKRVYIDKAGNNKRPLGSRVTAEGW